MVILWCWRLKGSRLISTKKSWILKPVMLSAAVLSMYDLFSAYRKVEATVLILAELENLCLCHFRSYE